MTTLYRGNLPFSATASGMRGLFEQNGLALSAETRGHREPLPPRGGPPERDRRQ